MAEYETEEQQVEALKKWWSDNAFAVLLGVGLGLLLIFGYRYWQGAQLNKAEMASSKFTTMLESLDNEDDGKKFLSLVGDIRDKHTDSPYAVMASLAEARFQVENNQLDEAETALRWAIDKGSFSELAPIARLRLARVLNAMDRHEEALSTLESVKSTAFAGHVEEIRGDIHLDLGDKVEAVSAYKRAQSSNSSASDGITLQMKIDDLAGDDQS